MSDIAKIVEQVTKLAEGMEITQEAAEKLMPVPSMFRGMALKAIVAKAQELGLTSITADLVEKVNKERMGG